MIIDTPSWKNLHQHFLKIKDQHLRELFADDPQRGQASVEFLFEDISDLRIDGFNHQNPIMGLSIIHGEGQGIQQRFRVKWEGTGVQNDVSFTSGRVAVLRVVDFNPFRRPSPTL